MKKLSAVLLTAFLLTNGISAFAAPTASPDVSPTPTVEVTASPEVSPSASPEVSPFPESTPSPSPTALSTATPSPHELSKQFVLTIDVIPQKHIIPKNADVELYSDEGELLAKGHRYVGWDTPYVTMTFDVPEYRMGEKFKIKLVSGTYPPMSPAGHNRRRSDTPNSLPDIYRFSLRSYQNPVRAGVSHAPRSAPTLSLWKSSPNRSSYDNRR